MGILLFVFRKCSHRLAVKYISWFKDNHSINYSPFKEASQFLQHCQLYLSFNNKTNVGKQTGIYLLFCKLKAKNLFMRQVTRSIITIYLLAKCLMASVHSFSHMTSLLRPLDQLAGRKLELHKI